MENSGLSASDVALMSRNDGFGFGDSSFVWIFGLLILMGMFNGGLGGLGNGAAFDRLATQSDVQYTSQFAQLLDGNRDIITQGSQNTQNLLGAINQAEYENINVTKDAQMQIQERLADIHTNQQAIIANQNECCCNTRLEIANQSAGINQNLMQNRYESALNTAAINENTTAQTQKILDALSANRMADMQNEIDSLKLAQATAGMLRFPNTWTYGAGPFPPLPYAPAVNV